jgi:hypothetical protein
VSLICGKVPRIVPKTRKTGTVANNKFGKEKFGDGSGGGEEVLPLFTKGLFQGPRGCNYYLFHDVINLNN